MNSNQFIIAVNCEAKKKRRRMIVVIIVISVTEDCKMNSVRFVLNYFSTGSLKIGGRIFSKLIDPWKLVLFILPNSVLFVCSALP